ncbi:hypothetical protein JYU34_011639 [Plutella xylostella]|uniref:Reverse transcriptase domain-containing protein n=1 Tax=Plutella xylostella TaxID=51655 RepID=A0ABQ7QD82_PLUXY|nr:hypothetical protein JYU34_011639 [Plutella xylostella]
MLHNRRFQVCINSEKSRWRSQRNGLPQGSVLAPTLFNIYTNDQPRDAGTARFLYADDLALASQAATFEEVEGTLTAALRKLGDYYSQNALRPNPSKTQSCAFHLRNHQANRELDITWEGVKIQHCSSPKYLGVTLDRSLTYKTHCQTTKKKVSSRNNLLRRLTSTSWGASPQVLRTSSLALCFSAAEYACPIWARSAHAREVDVALNDTVRIVTGCLKPTPLHKLYSLAGIAPPSIRRKVACSVEKAKQECDSRHPLYSHTAAPSRLKSRKAFLNSEVSLTDENPQNARLRLWEEKQPQDPFLPLEEKLAPGNSLPWHIWKTLNRLRAEVGCCKDNLCKWGYTVGTNLCDCGTAPQTMEHLLSCPLCPSTCTREDLLQANQNAIKVASFWSGQI